MNYPHCWFKRVLVAGTMYFMLCVLIYTVNHVVIVVKLCCFEGLMEDRCTSNKHSR